MTQNLNHGKAKLCPTVNKSIARKLASFIFVLVLSAGFSIAAPTAKLPSTKVEMAAPGTGETIVIYLDHAAGAGASVSVSVSSEYAANYSGWGFGAFLNGSSDKIVVDLPGAGGLPSSIIPMECATITAVDAAGVVVARYVVIAQSGHWEVLEDTY